jgi:hypothetical protein
LTSSSSASFSRLFSMASPPAKKRHAIHSAWLPSRDVGAKSIPDRPLSL